MNPISQAENWLYIGIHYHGVDIFKVNIQFSDPQNIQISIIESRSQKSHFNDVSNDFEQKIDHVDTNQLIGYAQNILKLISNTPSVSFVMFAGIPIDFKPLQKTCYSKFKCKNFMHFSFLHMFENYGKCLHNITFDPDHLSFCDTKHVVMSDFSINNEVTDSSNNSNNDNCISQLTCTFLTQTNISHSTTNNKSFPPPSRSITESTITPNQNTYQQSIPNPTTQPKDLKSSVIDTNPYPTTNNKSFPPPSRSITESTITPNQNTYQQSIPNTTTQPKDVKSINSDENPNSSKSRPSPIITIPNQCYSSFSDNSNVEENDNDIPPSNEITDSSNSENSKDDMNKYERFTQTLSRFKNSDPSIIYNAPSTPNIHNIIISFPMKSTLPYSINIYSANFNYRLPSGAQLPIGIYIPYSNRVTIQIDGFTSKNCDFAIKKLIYAVIQNS